MAESNEWRDCKQYVLRAIDELQNEQGKLTDQLTALKVEFAVLKTKIITWGAVASIIGAVLGSSLVVGIAMRFLGLQ